MLLFQQYRTKIPGSEQETTPTIRIGSNRLLDKNQREPQNDIYSYKIYKIRLNAVYRMFNNKQSVFNCIEEKRIKATSKKKKKKSFLSDLNKI